MAISSHSSSFEIQAPGVASPVASERLDESQSAQLAAELAGRWHAGDRVPAEDILHAQPALQDQPVAVAALIYEEMCLRREAGEEVDSEECFQRFPGWRRPLEMLLECQRLLGDEPPPRFPTVGEALGEFQLLAELGRGLQGRVFLATQASLADRPLVIKCTPRTGGEHLSLARLQHMYIAPLLFVQEDLARRLLVLCMPYLGGITLARLLSDLASLPREVPSGAHLVEALARNQAAAPVPWPTLAAARSWLARLSADQAVCWIGACLADALHYAHERGLLHLDVKPSNVLLTADGLPMLLDFHLAQAPLRPGSQAPEWLGGTPGYMSPEQQAGLAALREGRPIPAAIDTRSDVYSLGRLLDELLGRPVASGRRRPWVPVALVDIVARCQAADPRQRYSSASALATDLRRQLANLPLRGVRNRSLAERWRKWRCRRPQGLAWIGAATVGLAAFLALGTQRTIHRQEQQAGAISALTRGRHAIHKERYEEALVDLGLGAQLVQGLPRDEPLVRDLHYQIDRAERLLAVQELHHVVEQARLLYAVDSLSSESAGALLQQARLIWDRRSMILAKLQPTSECPLSQTLRTDLLDLSLLYSDLEVKLAAPDQAVAAKRKALQVLDEAETLFGRNAVLYQARQGYRAELGLTRETESAVAAKTAWEHWAVGRILLRRGNATKAAAELRAALALEPQGLWSNFYYGQCGYRLGHFQESAAAFSACIALAPGVAGCFFNRAQAYSALGQRDLALEDLDRALHLDSNSPLRGSTAVCFTTKSGVIPTRHGTWSRPWRTGPTQRAQTIIWPLST